MDIDGEIVMVVVRFQRLSANLKCFDPRHSLSQVIV